MEHLAGTREWLNKLKRKMSLRTRVGLRRPALSPPRSSSEGSEESPRLLDSFTLVAPEHFRS
jgi:hypothetical protein